MLASDSDRSQISPSKSPRPAARNFTAIAEVREKRQYTETERGEERVKTEGKMQRAKRQKSEDKRADERLTLFLLVQL